MKHPAVERILETAIYVEDVDRAASFYRRLFGFAELFHSERGAGLDVAGRSVLLLFKKGGTPEAITDRNGTIPAHDGDGKLHFAFAVTLASLEEWESHLASCGVEVEARYNWERGGRSVYFRDPDNHLVELVTPGTWAIF